MIVRKMIQKLQAYRSAFGFVVGLLISATLESAELPRLKVSQDRHFLATEADGPFFYLADTAWELFHRLDRQEADQFLRRRAEQGFNVIQAVAIAEFDGATVPNRYGHLPLRDLDPTRPAVVDGAGNDYWDHVDEIVNLANSHGLYVGFLPTWGRYWHDQNPLFNRKNAEIYGEWLGRRYRNQGLIWILGGDRAVENEEQRETIRSMARGLRKGDEGRHLITFHPPGGAGSAQYFHGDDWLDFNLRQNGHEIGFTGRYDQTRVDYDRSPIKPVIDGEPAYEGHPIAFNAPKFGHTVAADVRRALYWDLFSGSCGHTYGHHSIWQFWRQDIEPINLPLRPWKEAIEDPGANQMIHGRRLIESRPFFTRVPDDDVVVKDRVSTSIPGAGFHRYVATRDVHGAFAMVYVPIGQPFKVRMDRISGPRARAWWFNPRTGQPTLIGEFETQGERQFVPPDPGEEIDWILVLDDVSKDFTPPAGGALARQGHEMLITSIRTGDTEIFRVNPVNGDARNLSNSPSSEDRYPCWSPDGRQVAFTSNRSGQYNLYVMDAEGGRVRQILNSPDVCYMPSWKATPNGDRIVFGLHGTQALMASIRPDGSDLKTLGEGHDPTLSPDGLQICYTGDVTGGVSVFVMNADGSQKRRIVQETSPVGATFPNWSPDGRQIVYSFPAGSALELFVISADGSNRHQLTSLGQVATPADWSPDGEWISFRLTDERYWSDPEKMKRTYDSRPADKRPVWMVRADGKEAHVVETLRFQCSIDGSRAAWKP